MKAVIKSIRISPKKLNLMAEMIRGSETDKALKMLELAPKKGAKILHKALKSAVANATNNFKQDENNLIIEEILVTKAATFKRWLPASRGRMSPILKRNSHLTIKIGIKQEEPIKETPPKTPAPQKAVKKKSEPKSEKKNTQSSKTVKA